MVNNNNNKEQNDGTKSSSLRNCQSYINSEI